MRAGAGDAPQPRKRPRLAPDARIELTADERRLVDALRGTVARFELPTVVRVAGGWVRDKLLGGESHDIDVALDDMTGEAFANLVNNHLAEQGEPTHRIGLIQANPEQSKHLETAALTVLGKTIDFVNLRCEEYHDASRIPSIRFGTAKEDAERRDFTINSLFFNVNDSCLEDLTGLGLADLRAGIIRTPLPPAQTFRDDPLRMLRAIRFASRFDFELDTTVQEALMDRGNHEALSSKISRERIGTELASMLRGPRPVQALELLERYDLLPVVLQYPDIPPPSNLPRIDPREMDIVDEAGCREALSGADWRARVAVVARLEGFLREDLFEARSALGDAVDPELHALAGVLHGFEARHGLNARFRPEALIPVLVRDALKLKATLANAVKEVVEAVPKIRAVLSDLEGPDARLQVGRLMCQYRAHFQLAMCLLVSIDAELRAPLEALHSRITSDWALAGVWNDPPVFNGKELIKALEFKRGGPHIGEFMSRQQDWMVLNRGGTNDDRKAKCLAHLAAQKEQVLALVEERARETELARIAEAQRKKQEKKRRREEEQRLKQAEGDAAFDGLSAPKSASCDPPLPPKPPAPANKN